MKKILVLCFIALAGSCFAQRVVLDSSFGDSGTLACKVRSYIKKVVTLPNGKIQCFGALDDIQGVPKPVLFQLDGNGKLDSTFGEKGILRDTISKLFMPADNFMNVQPDGRIFAASWNSTLTYITCYYSNGNPVLTFGKSGVLKLDTIENVRSGPRLISFTSCDDNKTIACWEGHYTKVGSVFGHILTKFDSTGSIDRSFGSEGFVFFGVAMKFRVDAITVLKDGCILCAGGDYNENVNAKTALFKLNPDGTFNNDFGIGGKVIIDVDPSDHFDPFFNTYVETARNVIELEDHRIIVSTVTNKSIGDFLIRLMPDGSLDKTFGNNGVTKLFAHMTDLAVQDDGSIFTTTRNQFNYFSSNGIVDSTINLSRKLFDEINCISIQDKDKIILGGSTITNNVRYYSIAKLNIGPPVFVPQIKAQTKSVSITPTSFSNTLTFRSEQSLIQEITLYDLNGRCVLSKSIGETSCTLNVNLAPGMYLCKIATSKGIEYHKLFSINGLN